MARDSSIAAGSGGKSERVAFSAETLDVLHVPFTYFPDPVGGTETYVAGLVRALEARGVTGAVAAPCKTEGEGRHDGVAVYRFARTARPSFAQAWGEPDMQAARSFSALLDRIRPRIVHLHSRTAAVSERLVDAAHAASAKVVFTYHTPTVTCARGTMMLMGAEPCDGRLDHRRCAACVLQSHGVPEPIAWAFAATPRPVGRALGAAGRSGGVFTALRASALVAASHRRFHTLAHKVDHFVAVCDWVAEVMRVNGVPDAKITLCRQGVAGPPTVREKSAPRNTRLNRRSPLQIGYFGRLDRTKGVDILVAALRRSPDLAVQLDIYGVRQAGSEQYAADLERAAASDPRISIKAALPPNKVGAAMAACDLVAVPSRWLETGPLVALEAFAAGVPVIGARLGGVSELVTDGVDGLLVDSECADAWAAAIGSLAANRERLACLHTGVHAPRTMNSVAGEMATLYRSMLDRHAG